MENYTYIKLRERPELKQTAAEWFHSKWGVPTKAYLDCMNREIRRRTRVVGAFPDGNSALMLVCARLRHVAGTQWGCKKYMNMKHLETMEQEPQVG